MSYYSRIDCILFEASHLSLIGNRLNPGQRQGFYLFYPFFYSVLEIESQVLCMNTLLFVEPNPGPFTVTVFN